MDDFTHITDAVIRNQKDYISTIHDYDIDYNANHIYLVNAEAYATGNESSIEEPGVDWVSSNRFIRNLNILQRKSADPILVHLKICGGVWEEGMAIYDAIKACPNHVTMLNYTHARSMSSMILQAPDKRVMMPHSTFMFHHGTIEFNGTVKQCYTETKQNKLAMKAMIKIYVDSMKVKGKLKRWSRLRIEEWLENQMDKKEEVYLNAEQAVDYGFADSVFGADGKYDWPSLLAADATPNVP